MRPAKIIHIDYGTKGNAGLYLMQILRAYSGPVPVDAYVYSEFPQARIQGRVVRLFDRWSRFIPWGLGQQVFKCLDLYLCFSWLVVVLWFKARKERLFVFVQFFQSFHAYKWFFKRISGYCTLIVTVHDAVELAHNYPKVIMSSRDEIIGYAHFLIVHGPESVEKLNYLSIPMLQIPFPLMATETAPAASCVATELIRFLFIGNIRKEKGVDNLVKAWRSLPGEVLERASLTIAGSYNHDLNIDFKDLKSCRLIFDYLGDDQFVELIQTCHYVVLPYWGGTNSGVLSMVAALNRPCITTRIPMFKNSPFFEEQLSIADPSDLAGLLVSIVKTHQSKYQSYLIGIASKQIAYQSDFAAQIRRVYDEIIR